jgi:hypothetical protein
VDGGDAIREWRGPGRGRVRRGAGRQVSRRIFERPPRTTTALRQASGAPSARGSPPSLNRREVGAAPAAQRGPRDVSLPSSPNGARPSARRGPAARQGGGEDLRTPTRGVRRAGAARGARGGAAAARAARRPPRRAAAAPAAAAAATRHGPRPPRRARRRRRCGVCRRRRRPVPRGGRAAGAARQQRGRGGGAAAAEQAAGAVWRRRAAHRARAALRGARARAPLAAPFAFRPLRRACLAAPPPTQAPPPPPPRAQAVQAQLQRCELLVKIGQFDGARMQLREGAFKSLRLDLGYGQEMYRLVPEKVRRWGGAWRRSGAWRRAACCRPPMSGRRADGRPAALARRSHILNPPPPRPRADGARGGGGRRAPRRRAQAARGARGGGADHPAADGAAGRAVRGGGARGRAQLTAGGLLCTRPAPPPWLALPQRPRSVAGLAVALPDGQPRRALVAFVHTLV